MIVQLPIYGLALPPNHDPRAICRGDVTAAILPTPRDYHEGAKMLISCPYGDDPWTAVAEIVSVRIRKLKDLRKKEYLATGFVCQDELFQWFAEQYKGLTPDTEVTLIRWTNIHGAIVDQVKRLDRSKPK